MNRVNTFIDNYNEIGNDLLDNYIIPLWETGKDVFIEETKTKYLITYISKRKIHKIKIFIENINQFSLKEDILMIINKNEEYKNFFLSAIEKTLDLDDQIQIYILAYLTEQYRKHNELNYWEISIYYNINSLSYKDLVLYTEMIESAKHHREEDNSSEFYSIQNQTLIYQIIKNKFVSIGVLLNDRTRFGDNSLNFQKTEYTDILMNLIKECPYLKNN